MTNDTSINIREIINTSGARAAERQLAIIGDNAGDDQLALAVADLLPGEVAMIAGESDYTKPSIIVNFLNGTQFIGALERLGAKWGRIEGDRPEVIYSLKQELADFVLSILLHSEGDRQSKLLAALVCSPLGRDVLVALPLKEDGCPEFLNEFDASAAQKGTWQELYGLIKDTDDRFFTVLRQRVVRLHIDEEAEEDEVTHPVERFLVRLLQSLSARAAKHLGKEKPSEKESEDVFDI